MMQCMETVVAVLFPDTSLRQKCWDIRCQWLFCIGRLVSKHRHVMLDCTLGKTGSNGVDHWHSFTTGQWGQTQAQAFCTDDWVCFTSESAHMVHCLTQVGTVGSCNAFEEDSPGIFFDFFSIKNTQAMQEPPELIDVRVVSAVRFWMFLPGVHGDLANLMNNRTWWSWSPVHGVAALEGDLSTSESHVVKTLGKTGSNGVDHWRSFTTGQLGQTQTQAFCTDDWVCFYLGERSHQWHSCNQRMYFEYRH